MSQQEIRLQFIELLLYWEGGFTKKQLIEQFNISRQQVTQDIKLFSESYCSLFLTNKHRHQAEIEPYLPTLVEPNVDIYLSWLLTQQFSPQSSKQSTDNAYQVTLPSRNVSPQIIQGLVQAIRERRRLEVNYVSLSHPEQDGRIFHPHTFVNTGLRWHVRGYCEKSQGYRDLVLSRFREQPELLDESNHTAKDDVAWNTDVKLTLAPDPRLSEEKQKVLINDYKMQNGQLILTTKAALANYLLKAMLVNVKYLDGIPEAQQLVLVNGADLKEYLYD